MPTSTPWTEDGVLIYALNGAAIAQVRPAGDATTQADDAALIVQAVNGHEAMLHAPSTVSEGIGCMCVVGPAPRAGCDCWGCCTAHQVAEALKLARGEA